MWTRSRRDRAKVLPNVLERGNNLEVSCWFCEKKGHRASECRKKSKDLKKGDDKSARKGKKGFEGKCFKCGKPRHM